MITQCITMGKRADLLKRTLESQSPDLRAYPALAVNDFQDPDSNVVFENLMPNGKVVKTTEHMGHHPVIDLMYQQVETPYIFHNEDDWEFTRSDFVEEAITLLNADPNITMVCVRAIDDMPFSVSDKSKIIYEEQAGVKYARFDRLHKQWHGYTFNPHITRKTLWSDFGGFSQYEKERHISRVFRREGRFVAFLIPPACHHIGNERGVIPRKVTRFKRFKNWVRGRPS